MQKAIQFEIEASYFEKVKPFRGSDPIVYPITSGCVTRDNSDFVKFQSRDFCHTNSLQQIQGC